MLGPYLQANFDRRMGRRILYALAAAGLSLVGVVYAFAVLYASAILMITLIGLPVLAAGLRGAALFGAVHRRLARSLLGMSIAEPAGPRPGDGFIGWIRSGLT